MLKVETRVHIRWMIRRDLESVLDVDRRSFLESWGEADYLTQLRRRDLICMVAETVPFGAIADDCSVMAFLLYELHAKRFHFTRLAVHPAYRRQRVGKQLVAKMADKLSTYRRKSLTVEVPDDNLGAQLFFRSQGFRAVRVIRGDDGDAYRMRLAVE